MKLPFCRPRRLSQKLMGGVILILLCALAGTVCVNSKIAERFYLRQQRAYLDAIGSRLQKELEAGASPRQAIDRIETDEKVLIAYAAGAQEPDAAAEELRDAFRAKGMGFQKFWLWDRDYQAAVQNGSQFRLYSQSRMNYSILVQYLSLPSGLYALAAIVPEAEGFIAIVNRISFLVCFLAILTALFFIALLTRHITKPLAEMAAFARQVPLRRYQPLQIRTGDELEEVADSLNQMAEAIEAYQRQLEEKNAQMKQLLSDVAHDLKTPLALVGMYLSGIQDGLDDGSFLGTIQEQNDKMVRIVEDLLHLSRLEQKEYPCGLLELDALLEQCIGEQRIAFARRELALEVRIVPHLELWGSRELLTELFANLLSNAAKYAAPPAVKITLEPQGQEYCFGISNLLTQPGVDPDLIWQPFYVGEASRNRQLAGTGLGLPIVKKIAERFGYAVSCTVQGREIAFAVRFPASPPNGAHSGESSAAGG